MKKHGILITIGLLLWSVVDLNGVQWPPLKALVSSDNVTKVEKILSTASAVLTVCILVTNKCEWDICDQLYPILFGMLTVNVISNGILWVAYKKQRAVYQLISPIIVLGVECAIKCDSNRYISGKSLRRLGTELVGDFFSLGIMARECVDGYAFFSEKTCVLREN